MKKAFGAIILFVALVFLGYRFAGPDGVFSAPEPDIDLATIAFDRFDQSRNDGWRWYARRGKHAEAAKLIDGYIEKGQYNKAYATILHFHAGQMHASAGDYATAISRFKKAKQTLSDGEMRPFNISWNQYVDGTIAFLENDKEALQAALKGVLDGPKDYHDSNGKTLSRLLARLGKPYADAY